MPQVGTEISPSDLYTASTPPLPSLARLAWPVCRALSHRWLGFFLQLGCGWMTMTSKQLWQRPSPAQVPYKQQLALFFPSALPSLAVSGGSIGVNLGAPRAATRGCKPLLPLLSFCKSGTEHCTFSKPAVEIVPWSVISPAAAMYPVGRLAVRKQQRSSVLLLQTESELSASIYCTPNWSTVRFKSGHTCWSIFLDTKSAMGMMKLWCQLTQSWFDAIRLSRPHINQIQKLSNTTPICSKKTEIQKLMGKEQCWKFPKSDIKEPSQSRCINMTLGRG